MQTLKWLVGLALLALLAFLCVSRNAPRIEAELTADSRAAFDAAGLSQDLVVVDGRDACVRLPADAPETARGREALAGVTGLRVIEAGCDIAEFAAASFCAERAEEEIVVEGTLSASDADAVYAVIDHLAPRLPVRRSIVTANAGDAAWTDALPAAINLVAARVLDPSLCVEAGQAVVSGRVPSDGVREGVVGELAALFPGLEIVDELAVRPPETATELQRGLDQFVASRVIEFEFDSDALTSEGRATADEVGALLAATPDLRVEIVGHTDSVGAEEFNLDLSQRRALAVRNHFVQDLGLSAARFETTGFGETRPIADNATPEGRQENRRTEFRVLEEN
jgi:OOP family OmpA-OmpF porin